MAFGILLLIGIGILWVLFIEGALWKLILFFAGWAGLNVFMRLYVPDSNHTVMVFMGEPISWAELVPTAICILALATTKVRQ